MHPILQLLRFQAPAGFLLPLWPSLWAIALAVPPGGEVSIDLMLLFFLGAISVRSLGCIINDFFDRKLDAQVARTKDRPLACGSVSLVQAALIAGVLALLSLWILCQLPRVTILLGLAMVPLMVLYPLMKRITHWPQIFLGVVFNGGVLLGWSAVTGSLAFPPILLYVATCCWTIGYDTIYAFQDRPDDVRVGIKSSAIRTAAHPKRWLSLFYGLFLLGLIGVGLVTARPFPYYAVLVPVALHLYGQIHRLDIHDAPLLARLFRSNIWLGPAVLCAILL